MHVYEYLCEANHFTFTKKSVAVTPAQDYSPANTAETPGQRGTKGEYKLQINVRKVTQVVLCVGAFSGLAALNVACGGGGDGDTPAANAAEPTVAVPTNTPVPLPVVEIKVTDNKFDPVELRIKENTVVKWTWEGTTNQHSILLSGLESTKQTSGSFERKFPAGQGTFNYQCGVHGAAMSGKIIVE